MVFCHAPQTNLDISPRGIMSPCCKFRWDRYDSPPCNINNDSLLDYQQHPVIDEIKKDFDSGRWPLGCERCKIEEDNGISSKRQLDAVRWTDAYQRYNGQGWLTASIAFGNVCNLTCITCGPVSSSRWQQEYMARHGIDIQPNYFYKKNFVDDLLAGAPELIHLDVPGGEPLLSGTKEQFDLMTRLIEQGRAAEISLHYTTNATVFPDPQWWNLWQHFKEVDIQLSVDGVGARNSYIRYPSDWNTVLDNISKYQLQIDQLRNIRLSVSHTVSAYNVYYLPEFFNWCQNLGLPLPWTGRVHTPVPMRASVWPSPAKKLIIDNLRTSSHDDCHRWAGLLTRYDDSDHFPAFRSLVKWHDNYRDLDFAATFPELAEFL